MKMDKLQWLKEKALALADKFNLKLIVLFGSTAEGLAREQSDLDIAILAEDTTLSPSYKLSLLETVPEIFDGKLVDIAILNRCDPLLGFEVASSGIPLFEKEPGLFDEFQILAFRRHADAKLFLAKIEKLRK
jgi:predicted nucleotidyltransferase